MRVLVTGGRGTVGRGLIEELERRGAEVFSVDLHHSAEQAGFSLLNTEPRVSYARCDVAEFRQLERVFDLFGPFDFVYHAAAEFGRWNGEDYYEQLWRTNAIGTKNVIRLQERLGFRLIHFSSSEVYGDWPELMVEAVMEHHEVKQLNDYAMTKWVNEMQIRNSRELFGTESVIVRLFNTYGPGEYYSVYRSVNCRFLYCALHGIPWTVHRGHARTSSFLPDTVRTLANITENFRAGETYNVGGGHLHTIEELSDIVLTVTGSNPALVHIAEPERLTTTRKLVDTSKAVKDLGHGNTATLEEGMAATAEWMRGVYGIAR
jgi:dTDP-glucose 4,6-dehydratase